MGTHITYLLSSLWGVHLMTREQWKAEFIKEIRKLQTPAEHLYALLLLHPDEQHRGQDISDTLDHAELEAWNQNKVGVSASLLEQLYAILSLLPGYRSQKETMIEHYEVTTIQEYALNELLNMGMLIPIELPQLSEAGTRETLDQIYKVCLRWKVLLDPMLKEIEPLREEIKFIYKRFDE